MSLYIYAENDDLYGMLKTQLKNHRWSDSGFDIPVLSQSIKLPSKQHSFNLGIKVAAVTTDNVCGDIYNVPCLLLPRSSIYKTPYRMANSIGLIDSGYRGEVQAKVDIMQDECTNDEGVIYVTKGTRMFQIVRHDFLPWNKIEIVDNIEDLPNGNDDRGAGGFGSTGLQLENHNRT